MSSYDFDRVIDRRGYSEKWDEPPYGIQGDITPMWVADMDFAVPDFVLQGLRQRLEQPTLGYASLDARYKPAVLGWYARRHGVKELRPEQLSYQNSTIGALVSALQVFTQSGDPVLVNTPNYTGFTNALRNTGRVLVQSPLRRDQNGIYRMDFADMEQKIHENGIRCFILCTPHNPTGRVWTADELQTLGNLLQKHHVRVIVDEIWADFVFTPNRHLFVPQISDYLRANSIVLGGATKTFNLAGLHACYAVVCDETLRRSYEAACTATHYNEVNTLTAQALIAAYEQGDGYVDALLDYIRANMQHTLQALGQQLPKLGVYLPEGTYTMWLSLQNTGRSDEENRSRIAAQGLVLSPAQSYNDQGHFRMNLACPRAQLQTALQKLALALA